jgi:hypothetical protein
MSVLFERDGDLYVPTGHTRGPWDPDAQHGGAPAALIAREVEQVETAAPMRCTRLTIDILRPVPIAPLRVQASVLRPGLRMQIVDVVVHAEDTEVCRARATRLRIADLAVPASPADPQPGPRDATPRAFTEGVEMFPTTGVEVRFARGSFHEKGPALAWFRPRIPLVEGEEWSPLQRVAAAADFGNGISRVVDWETHLFVNPDLSIHLHREPVGEWVGLDARTDLDRAGVGQALSILYDEHGRIGAAAQSLYVDER